MKVCLYLEFYHFWKGIFFKNIGTGLLSSYKNQRLALHYLKIAFTEKWDNGCDILQINTPWLKSLWLIKKARHSKKKIIIWAHVTKEDAMQVFRFVPFIAVFLQKYLTYVYNLADIILCPSQYTKGLLKKYGIDEKKLVVHSNAVDLKKFYKDSQLYYSGRKKYNLNFLTIGTVALVIPRKGVDTFLNLAAKFLCYDFIWFGKIYSRLLVKSLPQNISQNVKFTGYVENINEAYNALDIFLFPSYEENQGMVILEAAAVGLPILVRDLPVYNNWLIHGVNCLKAKNDKDFEQYINLLASDENLRKKLSRNARQLAEKESIEQVSVNLKKIYYQLLKSS
jgi:1,2-diacylglycerol-3-alpha-glucose alpha-1,2-glucosyltransferase